MEQIYAPDWFAMTPSQDALRGFGMTSNSPTLVDVGAPVSFRLNANDLVKLSFDEGPITVWLVGSQGDLQNLGCNVSDIGPLSAHQHHQLEQFDTADWVRAVLRPEDLQDNLVLKVTANDVHVILCVANDPRHLMYGGDGGRLKVEVRRDQALDRRFRAPVLGDLRDELIVDRATARSYQLQAGEFVQIIDLDGRQCTDFMAMRLDGLDRGEELFIDSTVSRTLTRTTAPTPGLLDKFFDQAMQPMLAVTRDTVGRHDTFGLACTQRGYEDRGFPGHVSCSENINGQWAPLGVQRRAAWPAINFFYNTFLGAGPTPGSASIISGEAWSRPGDYVCMQALTDLLCVSTSCPDDVDPINGWHPTDVMVRIYKPTSRISKAVAYRPDPQLAATMTEQSAFHTQTSQRTNQFAVARNLWLPTHYDTVGMAQEIAACRKAVTVQDMSSLRKYDVVGPDVLVLLQLAMSRDIAQLSQWRGTYALLCDDSGQVIDDGTLFNLGGNCFRWCCGSEESGEHLKVIAQEHRLNVYIRSLSNSMPNLAVQGPNSRELMKRICFTQPTVPGLDTLRWFGCTVARLFDRDGAPFFLSRTGYTGELGYEIFCHRSDATEIWQALFDHGEDLGVTPMGGHALESIRIEAGLMAANAEFGPGIDVFEAGLGFAVDLNKSDFVGMHALVRNKDRQRRKLVGLLIESQEVPQHGHLVFSPTGTQKRDVGVVTSATYSFSHQQSIAMARVNAEAAEIGNILEIGMMDGRSKRLTCKVVSIPFVDPKRTRARS